MKLVYIINATMQTFFMNLRKTGLPRSLVRSRILSCRWLARVAASRPGSIKMRQWPMLWLKWASCSHKLSMGLTKRGPVEPTPFSSWCSSHKTPSWHAAQLLHVCLVQNANGKSKSMPATKGRPVKRLTLINSNELSIDAVADRSAGCLSKAIGALCKYLYGQRYRQESKDR